ncbi:MAG: hypothetical protein KJ065_07115 [Anaerolineae bacterium]|nr:hypothetical protein [Anaerolineae bacterium]
MINTNFGDLQAAFDTWLHDYNSERPPLGYRNMGRCPIETVFSFTRKLSA